MATKTIKFLQGGGFVERQTNADTVEQLRSEFPDDISAAASVDTSCSVGFGTWNFSVTVGLVPPTQLSQI